MSRAAKYFIAQHVPDLMRHEARNIGVFVEIDRDRTSRFFGETSPGKIDGKKIKALAYPDVYRQWVDYWSKTIKEENPWESLLENGSHYRVIPGGEVWDIGNDSMHDVAEFLFASLVSEGGSMALALGGEDEPAVIPLQNDVVAALLDVNILFDDGELLKEVRHPVRRWATVAGKTAKHHPAFVQDNGRLVVMDTVDFTTTKKNAARDHAGLMAFMFGDIAEGNSKKAETISIVRTPLPMTKRTKRLITQ